MFDNQTWKDRQVELDLLQRRLQNKTQRVTQIIQFNIVALSAVAVIVQIGDPQEVQVKVAMYVGSALMLVSIGLAVCGITLNSVTFPWSKALREVPKPDQLVFDYRDRNRWLGWLTPLALLTGGLGAGFLLIGGFQLVGIEPFIEWWLIGTAIVILFAGFGIVGYWLAKSTGSHP